MKCVCPFCYHATLCERNVMVVHVEVNGWARIAADDATPYPSVFGVHHDDTESLRRDDSGDAPVYSCLTCGQEFDEPKTVEDDDATR